MIFLCRRGWLVGETISEIVRFGFTFCYCWWWWRWWWWWWWWWFPKGNAGFQAWRLRPENWKLVVSWWQNNRSVNRSITVQSIIIYRPSGITLSPLWNKICFNFVESSSEWNIVVAVNFLFSCSEFFLFVCFRLGRGSWGRENKNYLNTNFEIHILETFFLHIWLFQVLIVRNNEERKFLNERYCWEFALFYLMWKFPLCSKSQTNLNFEKNAFHIEADTDIRNNRSGL